MPSDDLETLARLRGLLHVTRAVRDETHLADVLDAVARTIAESLGYRAVVVNLYRPAWNDFAVTTVYDHDPEGVAALMGTSADWESWQPLLDERFHHGGAYFIPRGEFDWTKDMVAHTPSFEPSDDPDAWHPEDALFAPLWDSDGSILGIISVDEPLSGRKPSEEDMQVLSAVAGHAALAIQNGQEAARMARHRRGLEELLAISSRLTESLSVDVALRAVCEGITTALGFHRVRIDLADESGLFVARASIGWSSDQLEDEVLTRDALQRLIDPDFEIEGCYLFPLDEALARLPGHVSTPSERNGRGPHAWNRHWLLVPLTDRSGEIIGGIWVDDPEDRLVPPRDVMQALRVFANQATAAIDSAAHFEEVRYLAEHDPLTRLLNRRAFTRRLGVETARSGRYHRPFALLLCDLDGFKRLNDRHGHPAGDEALAQVGALLSGALRSSDVAFRVGGDEFALILPETDEPEVRAVVDRVAADLADAGGPGQGMLRASFGVALFPRDGDDPERLYKAADEAMYSAKRCGEMLRFAA